MPINMEFKLPYEIKQRLFEEINNFKNPFNLSNEFSIVDFLLEIVNLYDIPSSSDENENGYQEALENLIRTNDWSHKYAFNKFGIIVDNQLFKKFLEIILNKNSRHEDFNLLAKVIDKSLKKYYFEVKFKSDENFELIYYISDYKNKYDFGEIKENDIPIFVVDKNFEPIPDIFPCFTLRRDVWNDYGYETSFDLSYYEDISVSNHLGRIKILNINNLTTFEVIDKKFYKLDENYCSLLQYVDLYIILKEILKEKTYSFLAAINDVGAFPSICEKYENENGFKLSLVRNEKEAEQIFRTLRNRLEYGDISDSFNFEFIFNPIYSKHSVNFEFNFKADKIIPRRLYCIIGKNGVGKTLFIKDLLYKLSEKSFEKILPRIPLYGKVIISSFSYFDLYGDINSKLDFNFLFCGLVDNEIYRPLSSEDISAKINSSINKIIDKISLKKYYLILKELIDEELLNDLFDSSMVYLENTENYNEKSVFYENNTHNIINIMSSGQRALFYIITQIVANIRYNSLLIFDEPETHLHPNAITEFMEVIMQLLEEFDSYCIITSHSPLVIREVFSESIYVFEKDKDVPRVRKLEIETFGENLSTITNETFGNKDVSKYYIRSIEKLVKKGKSYDEIESEIKGEVPLNLNVKILIKSLIANRDEEFNEF